jgi:uncharacterized protein
VTLDPVAFAVATFLTGLAAGWVDSIAGGGGLITIPVLMSLGVPAPMVLGTNKFQASFGSLTAAHYYVRKGVVGLRELTPGILWTLAGSAAGAWAVQQIDPSVLGLLIPSLLLAIALYMFFMPSVGLEERPPRMRIAPFFALFGSALGFYDGFFGPGVGSFWAIACVGLLGHTLTRATGATKVMNATSNLVSFVVFLIGGHVLFTAGITMAVGQIAGARLGSGMAVRRGARLIRPVFIVMVMAIAVKLLLDRIF